MSKQEVFITDDASSLIDRKETQEKLNKLEHYLKKVDRRLTQIAARLNEENAADVDLKTLKKGIALLEKKHEELGDAW